MDEESNVLEEYELKMEFYFHHMQQYFNSFIFFLACSCLCVQQKRYTEMVRIIMQ